MPKNFVKKFLLKFTKSTTKKKKAQQSNQLLGTQLSDN